MQRHQEIIKKRAVKLLFSIARGLFMKFRGCGFGLYSISKKDNKRKCRNYSHFIFFHIDLKKGGTMTCFFSSPVQRHLRLVANFDDVKIHSTLGGYFLKFFLSEISRRRFLIFSLIYSRYSRLCGYSLIYYILCPFKRKGVLRPKLGRNENKPFTVMTRIDIILCLLLRSWTVCKKFWFWKQYPRTLAWPKTLE